MDQPSKSLRELLVWQKAHAFALRVYRLTEPFPTHERYELTTQLRRAAGSIGASLVEGYRRRTTPDKARFYNTAQGSADECLDHLILARDLGCADTGPLQIEVEEVSRRLQGDLNGLDRNS